MGLVVEHEVLKKAIPFVCSTLEVVQIKTTEDRLILGGLDPTHVTLVKATIIPIDIEPLNTAADSRYLSMITELVTHGDIKITNSNERITFSNGEETASIPALEPRDQPDEKQIEEVISNKCKAKVNLKSLINAINKIGKVSEEVKIEAKDNKLIISGTNDKIKAENI